MADFVWTLSREHSLFQDVLIETESKRQMYKNQLEYKQIVFPSVCRSGRAVDKFKH